ncbi:glutathione binding-like protein [Phyllobacterium chamaecytisi]|uniref:glutathione binding-like protein n=1 Tax=Phyllobacterium chamaecytisi TaxID=2876082 RepID=UPI001CCA737B|nr:glutathione binding-like protein [Phyllobacterium sp. KW56]MBZ9603074.1 glutathione S-transferase C-terminal domain-containing protein [Phyllobacterium sp. KW56]
MKLYYAKGTCSLATHIALREFDLPFSLVRFDMRTRKLDGGADLESVNKKGLVPVLELEDGQRLTEVAAILQYIAHRGRAGESLNSDPLARFRMVEMLNFIATEIHKAYWPIFHGGGDEENAKARTRVGQSFLWTANRLEQHDFILGDHFTIADAYLFTTLNWARPGGIDLSPWPVLGNYMQRLRARPAVDQALRAEGLLQYPL